MLYPNYFFDIFSSDKKEEKLIKLYKFNKKYIQILKYIKENMKKCNKIKLFVWIN